MSESEQKQETSKSAYILPIILVTLLSLIFICSILTLLGPTVGNVFSRIG